MRSNLISFLLKWECFSRNQLLFFPDLQQQFIYWGPTVPAHIAAVLAEYCICKYTLHRRSAKFDLHNQDGKTKKLTSYGPNVDHEMSVNKCFCTLKQSEINRRVLIIVNSFGITAWLVVVWRHYRRIWWAQPLCFFTKGKHWNLSTVNFLADEITAVTFKASSSNFLSLMSYKWQKDVLPIM